MAKKETTDRVFMQNAIKTIATNIRFASVDNPVSSLVITSSIPNEGKSTVAVSLAQAMASGGQRVLLVECDMRRRSVASMIGAHARTGIYSVLSGQVALSEAVVETGRGFQFLDCEPQIPNPVDVLSSRRFKQFVQDLRSQYNFVIFDTPPLSAFVDAAVLSTVVDGTIMVVRQNFVRRDELTAAYAQLQKADAHVIGAVMNYCESDKSDYYYSYYAKDGKKAAARSDAPSIARAPQPAPRAEAAPAAAPAPAPRPAPAAQAQRPAPAARPAAPGLRPLPPKGAVAPDSTAQFLANAGYRPHSYEDE